MASHAPAGSGPAPGQGRFMFVEYSRPPAAPVKGQKRRRGGPSEVRAFITQEFHRKLKVRRVGALKGNVPLPDRTKRANLSPAASDESAVRDGDDDDDAFQQRGIKSASGSPTQEDMSLQLSVSPGPGSWSVLGQGRMDPFDVLPVSRMPQYIQMVLDHALVHSWPRTMPVRSEAVVNPVKSAWLKCAMEHPVVFHAFIYATTLHILCAYNGREIIDSAPLLRLSHKVETIKLVNEQLHALKGPPSDALIMAVAILSVHGSRDSTEYPKVHPLSPMAGAQHVDIYGSMINDEKHIQGILLLIKEKGGLDNIELYGLANTMQLCDLYFASKYACRPNFPWRHPPQSLVVTGKHLLDPAAIDLDSRLGRGFRYLRQTAASHQLLEALESISEVTTALDHYARGGPTAPVLVDLIEARNCAQHRLLSQIPLRLDLTDGEMCVHHAIRLAALIFNDMVIFPLPAAQGVKPRVAQLLRPVLETCNLLRSWQMHAHVLTWALTMGAIAASFTTARSWYIDQLSRRVSALQIYEWSALESTCSWFLWWKPVCSEPSQRLWDEMFPSTVEET